MIKLAWKLNDKIMLVNGGTARFLGAEGIKHGYRDPGDLAIIFDSVTPMHLDWNFIFSPCEAGYFNKYYDHWDHPSHYQGNGMCSSPLGSYLNKNSMCKIGKHLYTIHGNTLGFEMPLGNYKIVEWDGVEDNVDIKTFPYGTGGRIVHGYAAKNNAGWTIGAQGEWEIGQLGTDTNAHGIANGGDLGLINYNGNLLGFGFATNVTGTTDMSNFIDLSGVSVCEVKEHGYIYQGGGETFKAYYSFLYEPKARNGSGLTTYNFYAKDATGIVNDPGILGKIDYPSWMESEYDDANPLRSLMSSLPYYNYNIMSVEEFQGKFYASNAVHVMQFNPDSNEIKRIVTTDENKYMPSPKWLNKFNGKLYMFAASGTVSEIIPNSDNNGAVVNDIIDLSYVYPYNINYGGIHVREMGLERATKSEICTYNDEMLVFAQMGSGTYYLATSGDATIWTNRTTELPDIIRYGAGNISTFEDPHSKKLYISFSTMVQGHGMNGSTTWGNDTANVVHLYEYDGITFDKINWFVNPSYQNCGGFMGFDYQGPHIEYPSGLAYPLSQLENNEVGPSGEVLAIEPYRELKFQWNVNACLESSYGHGATEVSYDDKFLYSNINGTLSVYELHTGPLDDSVITVIDSRSCLGGCDIISDGSGYIFVAASSGIISYGVDDITGQLTQVNYYYAAYIKTMIKNNNYIYLARDNQGISSYKVSPSGKLTFIDTYNLSDNKEWDLCIVNDKLYSTSIYGLETWGISNSGTLAYSGVSTSGAGLYRNGLAYYNGYLYVSSSLLGHYDRLGLYTLESSGAKFERFITVPDLDMSISSSPGTNGPIMKSDNQFLYFNNHPSGLCFYKNDTSGNLILQHTLPQTLGSSEEYVSFVYPSGEFDWNKHNLAYTLSNGSLYGYQGGLKAWDLSYKFLPIEEASPVLIKCRDHAILDYKIIDDLSRNVDVNIEYSDNNGCTWNVCDRFKDYETLQYLGDGTTSLTSSPSGEWHTFFWDFVKPFGYNVEYPYCQMRITPSISYRG